MSEATPAMEKVELTGGVIVPALAAVIYGAYLLLTGNTASVHPYILLVAGLVSVVVIGPYAELIASETVRSWGKALLAFSVFVPFGLSLYLMGFLGILGLWKAVSGGAGFWVFAAAVFGTLIGWRMLFMIGKLQRTLSDHLNRPVD